MDFLVGSIVGGFIGWLAFARLRMNSQRGPITSLLLGALGGGLGMQVASIATVPDVGAAGGVFALVMASAAASACLLSASMIGRR